jgi:hypothetical protein
LYVIIHSIEDNYDLYLDYDQEGNVVKWHPDKQGKRKKKFEGTTHVDPATSGTGKIRSPLNMISVTNSIIISGLTNPIRDVHKFIFDDEAVVVDDCSFVLPYIENAYYYPPTTPPPVTDLPLANPDEYATPLVPAYTEQQLKELLRRQV